VNMTMDQYINIQKDKLTGEKVLLKKKIKELENEIVVLKSEKNVNPSAPPLALASAVFVDIDVNGESEEKVTDGKN